MAQTGGFRAGKACPLSPGISDINLFRYCQGVIDLDADRPPIDQGRFCASKRMSPKQPRVQSDPRRAYWRVVKLILGPRRPVNKNSPGLLLAAFR
jgi:hypothetical protein